MSIKPGSGPPRRPKNPLKKAAGERAHKMSISGLRSARPFPPTISVTPGMESKARGFPQVIRPGAPDSTVLAEEDVALYRDQLPNWRGHQGEHVLIHGGKVHGFFASRSAARREGFNRFGYVAFLVKQVDLDEKPRPLAQVIL